MMTEIKRVNGWQTSDGQVFTNEFAARAQQAELDLAELIEKDGGCADHKLAISNFIEDNMQVLEQMIGYILYARRTLQAKRDKENSR